MAPTRTPTRPAGVARTVAQLLAPLALVALLAGCTTTVQTAKAVPNDPELAKTLDELARTYESLDANRILALYEQGDYSASWDGKIKLVNTPTEQRAVLTGQLADLKDFKVSFDPNFEAWRDGPLAWTSRRFTAVGTRKSGEKVDFVGWHSAIWKQQQDGRWLMAYEHVGGGPQRPPAPPPPPPPPPPAPTPPPVVTLPFADAYFDFDKAKIRKDQTATLDADADLLKRNPDVRVLIEGHCDERGGETYNFGLGERRADAVKKYLVSKGIEPERLATVSYGKRKPFEAGRGEQVWSKNRRAHFVQLEK